MNELPPGQGGIATNARELAESIIAYCGETPPEEPYDPIIAALGLAETWLVEHPADDTEPLTKEWVRLLGEVVRDEKDALIVFVSPQSADVFVRVIWEMNWQKLTRFVVSIGRKEPTFVEAKTRGDVRRLCSALGITLDETGGRK